jgi:hypothetical protein
VVAGEKETTACPATSTGANAWLIVATKRIAPRGSFSLELNRQMVV